MILLTVVTSGQSELGVKTNTGIVIPSRLKPHSHSERIVSNLPPTVARAIADESSMDHLREVLRTIESDPVIKSEIVVSENDIRIGLPFVPRNIICIGLNYKDHAAESGVPLPSRPLLFAKYTSCVIGPGTPIVLPPDTQKVDYEAELAVVIGRSCRSASAASALDYVAGYMCMNDVSARDFQSDDGQWVRAKSQDTFGPMGPYLATRDEIKDPQKLAIRCWVNEDLLQNSNTANMIFPVAELIAFVSRGITLEPGDVITTGTPHGVGFARNPPRFLKNGDQVTVEVEGLGKLSNPVKAM